MTQHRKVLRLIVMAGGSLVSLWLTAQPALAESLETGVAAPFDEQVRWRRLDCGVRVFVKCGSSRNLVASNVGFEV